MDDRGCQLLQGSPALIAQVVLASLALSALILKRWQEDCTRRPLNVWLLDASKQIISQGAAHICGIVIALVAHHAASDSSECSWYMVTFTVDSTLGVLLTVSLHWAVLRIAGSHSIAPFIHTEMTLDRNNKDRQRKQSFWEAIRECGNYGSPAQTWRWAAQTAEWTSCVITARAICGTMVGGNFNEFHHRHNLYYLIGLK